MSFLGITFLSPLWLALSFLFLIALLIIIGYYKEDKEDSDTTALKVIISIIASIFWTISITIAFFVILICKVISFGEKMRASQEKRVKKREMENFIDNLNEHKSKK